MIFKVHKNTVHVQKEPWKLSFYTHIHIYLYDSYLYIKREKIIETEEGEGDREPVVNINEHSSCH